MVKKMSEAEDYIEEETAKFTVDTFDGQEDSTYKYIHIDKAKEIALEGVRIAREKAQARRLPINWRSHKEVIELVRKEIKNAEEEASNVFLPEQGKNKHEIEVLKIELKRVGKLYNSALLSVPVLTDLEIEVRVREETAREIFDWFDKKATLENNFIILEDKIKTFKKRFLVKSEV